MWILGFLLLNESFLSRVDAEMLLLDIVQSFPLLSYCIVDPTSVYIYKSNM